MAAQRRQKNDITIRSSSFSSRSSSSSSSSSSYRIIIVILLFCVCYLVITRGGVYNNNISQSLSGNIMDTTTSTKSSATTTTTTEDIDGDGKETTISSGISGGIKYYHCRSSGGPSSSSSSPSVGSITRSIVLLHGARFTKEEWKRFGIMDMLCNNDNNEEEEERTPVSVVALDLSVTSKYDALLKVLDSLSADGLIQLPIDGIVTPSASGSIIIDWILNDSSFLHSTRTKYIKSWIPVASNALLKLTDTERATMSTNIANWPILAIYGNRDPPGKKSSELLMELINNNDNKATDSTATKTTVSRTQELLGTHPCYLDSPQPFVHTVIQFITSKKL